MEIDPSFNTWTSIFFVVAAHGIVLAAVFLSRKRGRSMSNKLLGAFLLLFSLNIVSNMLLWTRYSLVLPHFLGIAESFHFLYGPILFFYILSVIKPGRSWKAWDSLHLIPLLFFLIWMLPFYLQSGHEKSNMILEQINANEAGISNRTIILATIKSLFMAGYASAITILIQTSQKWVGNKAKRMAGESYLWLRLINYSFWGYILSYITYFVLRGTIDFQVEYDYIITFTMSIFIFGIGYIELIKPSFLSYAHHEIIKYENSSLSADQAEKYLHELLSYMNREKPYLDGNLKMDDLSKNLSIPYHHLSQILNEKLDKNFFEFINEYRVKEAKRILRDPGKKDYKMMRVALESGFNNRTTFYNVFKRETGVLPSRFREKKLNEL